MIDEITTLSDQPDYLFLSNAITIRNVEYAVFEKGLFDATGDFMETVTIIHTPNGAYPIGRPDVKKTVLMLREQEHDGYVGKMIMTFYNPAVTRKHISEILGEPLKPNENGDELVVFTATWVPQDQYEHELERVLHDQLRI